MTALFPALFQIRMTALFQIRVTALFPALFQIRMTALFPAVSHLNGCSVSCSVSHQNDCSVSCSVSDQNDCSVSCSVSDQKPVDKAKAVVKASGLQRSCSDAGRERGKPPSGLVRPTPAGAFGYRKSPPATGTATVMSSSGTTISSGSATVGKTPKSSAIPIMPLGVVGGGDRKNSLDVSNLEQGFLSPNARGSIQYRSLPRPAKSSAMSLLGRPPSAASRPISSTLDSALLGLKPAPSAGPALSPTPSPALSPTPSCGGRGKEWSGGGVSGKLNRASLGPVNQTDREKEKARAKAVASSDSDCGLLKGLLTPGEASAKLQGLRQSSGSKYAELSSPVTHRYCPAPSPVTHSYPALFLCFTASPMSISVLNYISHEYIC